SGYTASVRAVIPATKGHAQSLRIVQRYYAPIKSDGKEAWRPATVEVGGDVAIAFADLETRYGCAAPGPCDVRVPPAANPHVIRWGRQGITGVPVTLMAQLAPAYAPTVPSPATPDMAAPQQSTPTEPANPSNMSPDTPQDSNGM